MSEDKKINIVCRVCLDYSCETDTEKGLSLFEEYNDCLISDQINAISNVGIKEGDGLPDKICTACLLELQTAYKFKLKCENTNEILLSAVNNVPTNYDVATQEVSMKEEFLEDEFDFVEEDNISLADWQANADVKPEIEPPSKPSRAIDLKLECHDCGGSFKSKCKLRVHWKKIHLAESLKCSNCLRKFKTFAAYKSHQTRNLQSCAVAGQVRIEGEGKKRIFHCKECNYKSVRIKDVTAHIVTHTGERPFHCDLCPKAFTQRGSLIAHKECAHKMYANEVTCQYCGKSFKGKSKLYRHIKSHKYNNFPCKICNSILKTKEGLRNHTKRHTGIKEFACEMCPTAFFTSSELYNHRTKVHLKLKNYTCEICSYKTASHGSMSKHRARHAFSKFACSICGTFLENEQQLSLHKKKHTDRQYECNHCNKKYYTRKSLLSHIRKIHRIVKLNDRRLTNVSSVKSEFAKDVE